MKTLVSATILLISLTNNMAQAPTSAQANNVVRAAQPVQRSVGVSTNDQRILPDNLIAVNRNPQAGDVEAEALQTVLVVPGADLKPESLANITEDLMVMCRIFDKALHPGVRPLRTSVGVSRGDLALLGRLLAQRAGQTQGLYLDGYGALFFVQVDFPLAAPQQQKQEAQPQEPGDRVWSQTMSEIRGQPEGPDAGQGGPAYDGQKVENLKTTLLRTLGHAANLRIRPQDQVTIVVGSESRASPEIIDHRLRYLYEGLSARREIVTSSNAGRTNYPAPDPAATLVLRTGKSDLDALAAGRTTAEQFAAKVMTLWSQPQAQGQEPPSTQPPAPSAAPR